MESKIKTIQNNYYNLLGKMALVRGKCYRNGFTPKEIWLGPKEREILALKWLYDRQELSLSFNKEFSENFFINDTVENLMLKLKGSTVYGMTIRFAQEDGIWAGVSFSDNEV